MKIQKNLLVRNQKVWDKLVMSGDAIGITEPLTMIFPSRFLDIGVADIGATIDVTGIVLVTDEKHNYVNLNILNKLRFTPNTVETIKLDDEEFIQMEFTPENGFISTRDVIMDDDIVFIFFEEFYFKGKIPFYVAEDDLPNLFLKSTITTTAPLGNNPVSHGLFTAVIARGLKNNMQKRYLPENAKFRWVPLNNPDLASDNNTSRLVGSYQTRGRTAALADDNPLETDFDKILTL